jgi:hypothetical protein
MTWQAAGGACTNWSTRGNTVAVIEHNLEVIKTADWIIDIGPEGGDGGGEIVACGRPDAIMKEKRVLYRPLPQGPAPASARRAASSRRQRVSLRLRKVTKLLHEKPSVAGQPCVCCSAQ